MGDLLSLLIILVVIWILARFLAGSLQKILTYAFAFGLIGFLMMGPTGFGGGCLVGSALGIRALIKK